MKYEQFLPYLLTMALVTYAVRAIPLVLIRRKIENQFILSFLYYMPYAVLSVMTVPAVFFVTNHIITAASGVVVALILAFKRKGLLTVAIGASAGVFLTEVLIRLL